MPHEQFPAEANLSPSPDVRFMNRLAALEAKKNEIEEKILEASAEEKMFLEISLAEIIKQTQSYHDSFGQYRKKAKRVALEEMAGKDKVEEIDKFKIDNRNKTNNLGLGNKFLDAFYKFKGGERDDDKTKH